MSKRRQLRRSAVSAFFVLALCSTSATADDVSDCQSPNPETRIQACTNLLKTRKLDGDNRSAIYLLRGNGYARIGNHDLAIRDFGQAMKIIPHRTEPHYLRGVSHAASGNYDAAIADFDTAISIDPNHADALTHRGRALLEVGDIDTAIADFTAAIAKGDPPDAFYGRARAYMHKREFAQAISDLDVAIAIIPNNPELLFHRAQAYLRAGETDRAIADFDAAILVRPDHGDAYYGRALAFIANGEPRRGIDDLDAALAIVPDHPRLLYHRGVANADAGDLDAAIADYDKVVEIQPDHPEVYYSRGLAYARKGPLGKAVDDFDRMIEMDPEHAGAIHHRDLALTKIGEIFREQIAVLESEKEQSPVHRSPEIIREGKKAADREAELVCFDRSTLARVFPPAPEGWSVDELRVTEIEPATRELEVFMDALGGLAAGRAVNETARVRLKVVRNYSNGDKAIKMIIDTENLEALGLIAAAHEDDDAKAELATNGFETTSVRGQRALVGSSGTLMRVGENGYASLECDHTTCDADVKELIDRIDFDVVERFVACEHRAEKSASAN